MAEQAAIELIRGKREDHPMNPFLIPPAAGASVRLMSPREEQIYYPFLSKATDTTGGMEFPYSLAKKISRGEARVIGGFVDDELKAIMVVSIYIHPAHGRSLMINHFQGEIFKHGFYQSGWPVIQDFAKDNYCNSLRVEGKGTRWLKFIGKDPEECTITFYHDITHGFY